MPSIGNFEIAPTGLDVEIFYKESSGTISISYSLKFVYSTKKSTKDSLAKAPRSFPSGPPASGLAASIALPTLCCCRWNMGPEFKTRGSVTQRRLAFPGGWLCLQYCPLLARKVACGNFNKNCLSDGELDYKYLLKNAAFSKEFRTYRNLIKWKLVVTHRGTHTHPHKFVYILLY